MTTIYEDIQALRARFKSEYGLDVGVDITAFSHDNSKVPGYPTRQTVDLACKGGLQVEPVEREHRMENGKLLRWFKFEDWRNGMDITLFRNSA